MDLFGAMEVAIRRETYDVVEEGVYLLLLLRGVVLGMRFEKRSACEQNVHVWSRLVLRSGLCHRMLVDVVDSLRYVRDHLQDALFVRRCLEDGAS